MSSQEQIEANRRNGALSNGPKTPDGKATSSKNAIRHGLLSDEALLPGEDQGKFEQFANRLRTDLWPCEPSNSVSQSALHAAYMMACMQANRAPMSKQMFGRIVKRYRPDVREFQRAINGTKQWMYGGITLRNENSNHSPDDGKAAL